ncbi:MAG TPA: class II fructose-bisphosphate aldolase, partial [Hyphomicrobiaceae bacterium]|nr:class II fructose-bisphosphate aldolase [Hyphomicrobiaceae bacterium]
MSKGLNQAAVNSAAAAAQRKKRMQGLRDTLEQAQRRGVAIGHFNIADSVQLRAVFAAAKELNVPVLVGVSEGEREFMGVRQIAALVQSLRQEFN